MKTLLGFVLGLLIALALALHLLGQEIWTFFDSWK